MLAKKKDGSYRFCVDFSHVNDVTKLDVHPIPRFDDALDRLAGKLVQNYSPFLT